MTKFLHYLTEGRTQSIDKDKALELVNKHCKNIGNQKIYRGIRSLSIDYGYVDSNKGLPRVSINTENYMTLLMDNLPSWKNYPKRSKGIICSTNPIEATSYGNAFQVIPYDNSKIGICPKEDIWFSFDFDRPLHDIPFFNRVLAHLFNKYNINVDDNNWNSFKNGIEKLDPNKILDDNDLNPLHLFFKLTQKMFKRDTYIPEHFNKLLDPKKHGFKLGINNLKPYREVWIQGEAILIRDNEIN